MPRLLLGWWLARLAQPLPLLPQDLYCRNASFRLAMPDTSKGGVAQADIPCDSRAFGRGATCCEAEDVAAVMEHLEHSISFGMRHLADRQEFLDQYSAASLQKHPCGDAPEAMLSARLKKLVECQQISQEILSLLQGTVSHLLCAACRGSAEGEGAEGLLVEAEAAISDEWRRLSALMQKVYQELRAHDAAVAGQMRQVGVEACVMDFIEAQRRGIPSPTAHRVSIRPWQQRDGVGGFRDTWQRYVDGLLAVSTELAEALMSEVTGLMLTYQHALQPESNAQFLLCGVPAVAPPPLLPARLPPSAETDDEGPEVTLLVAMPNPGTNLRFDFANDKATLSKDALLKHVSALNPLLDKMAQGESVKIVIVTANPDQASYLSRLITGHDRVRLIWRRFALFNAEELALFYAGRAADDGPRVVASFQVPSGGDAAALQGSAMLLAKLIRSPSVKVVWPQHLNPARPSSWPSQVRTAAGRGYGLALRESPDTAPCPALVSVLKDYLDFHRAARKTLLEQATLGAGGPMPRLLIYRCSAMGFCGGHGDRLNGLLGVFLMAIASRRAFFIDSARPVPLHQLLQPRRRAASCGKALQDAEFLLDWRLHGAISAVGRRTNYNDRYNDLVDDLPWILTQEPEKVVVMHTNQRVSPAVLQSKEAQSLMGPLAAQLLKTPYLHAALLELLFEPSQLLAARHAEVLEAAKLGRKRLIAVHFRAGDKSPNRCAMPQAFPALHALRIRPGTASATWRASWDVRRDWKDISAGRTTTWPGILLPTLPRLAFLPGQGDASIVHLDRSPLPVAVAGITDTWAQWLTIASADGVILSASNFGLTAAEAGRVPVAFLGAYGSGTPILDVNCGSMNDSCKRTTITRQSKEIPKSKCQYKETGTWNPQCVHGLDEFAECEYNGYQYSMEWYFIQMIREGQRYRAESVEKAQFIYFPQCVSQIYFALRQSYNLTHWQAIERAELGYLVPILRWAHASPAHRATGGVNFWTVFSMDLGRQDFPRSAAWLQPWSIGSLTGSPTWTIDQQMLHKSAFQGATSRATDSCWEEDTKPVALANEMFPARSFYEQDTVISIPSRFSPHPRSRRFGGRPVLGFFAGSPNSCARTRVLAALSAEPGFDVSTSFAKDDGDYRERMWRARFCFVLRGSSHTNNVRLYDVMAHGCVPVVVSDDFQAPLDRLLPWREMAIFLPTSSIPRLAEILRHEITEADRWRYFQNIALGSPPGAKGFPADVEMAKTMVAAKGLDEETLWSGLSASKVFEWHDSHFWMLFFADVASKLRDRMQKAKAAASQVRQGAVQAEENATAATSELLAAFRWLLDLSRRREQRPWLVVAAGGGVSPGLFRALGGWGDIRGCCQARMLAVEWQMPRRTALKLPQLVTHAEERCGEVAFVDPETDFSTLRRLQKSAAGFCGRQQCEASTERAQHPADIIMQVGRRCHPDRLQKLLELQPRYLWLEGTSSSRPRSEFLRGILQEGWLCFHAVRSRLSPIFEPFTGELQLGPGGALCAKETDESLDLLFRLNPKLTQGPERWGAQFIFKPEKEAANTRGRFLHSFS
ncbi:unnamed protein product [Symbiodinium sp. CCMP2456]|nr:unnamed protein product [Symbiodinium sp. CCMP2456]